MKRRLFFLVSLCLVWSSALAVNTPTRAPEGMVVSANASSSAIGVDIMKRGGTAMDAAIAPAPSR